MPAHRPRPISPSPNNEATIPRDWLRAPEDRQAAVWSQLRLLLAALQDGYVAEREELAVLERRLSEIIGLDPGWRTRGRLALHAAFCEAGAGRPVEERFAALVGVAASHRPLTEAEPAPPLQPDALEANRQAALSRLATLGAADWAALLREGMR